MSTSSADLWLQCKTALADSIPPQPFNTWIRPVELLAYGDEAGESVATFGVPDDFHRTWVARHYKEILRDAIADIKGAAPDVRFSIMSRPVEELRSATERIARGGDPRGDGAPIPGAGDGASVPVVQPTPARPSTLNPSYTFDGFIEADCNRLARSAALAVAQKPGATSFNPLLVYGKVGLGKTHLAHAIGNQVADEHPDLRVLYLTSEAFTNCFVHAVQHNMLSDFARSFREVDVLIVDDVQFLAGKEKTQEQFFHLFNDLHQGGAQIVLCADRPPSDIAGIEERLLSRFRWGLIADVQPPDFETRIAILQRRAERSGLELPYDVVEYMAAHVTDNIRCLEGAVNRLLASRVISDQPLTLDVVQPLIADLIQVGGSRTLTAPQIRDAVAERYGFTTEQLIGKTRKRPIVDARHIAMHFCKQYTQLSLEAIGRHFGGRDHSTVIHACRAVQARLDTDPSLVDEMDRLSRRLSTSA